MADIHIVREHTLGHAKARRLAYRWAEVAEQKLNMECTYREGEASDVVSFKRPGASGELTVTKDLFELDARLGLLLGVFKSRIESEIVRNLDQLLKEKDPVDAFEAGVAKHDAKQALKATGHHVKPSAKAAPRPTAKKAK